jgi:hypothetical protein
MELETKALATITGRGAALDTTRDRTQTKKQQILNAKKQLETTRYKTRITTHTNAMNN